MLTAVFFVLQLLVNYFLVSLILTSTIYKASNIDFRKDKTILYYSLFLGLPFNTVLLYYLLLLLPNLPCYWYVVIIYGLNISLSIWSRKKIIEILNYIVPFFKNINGKISLIIGLIIIILISVYVFKKPMTEHDTFEYAIQGRIFFKDCSIAYTSHRYDNSGFYFVGLHGFGFPLILTWELINAHIFGITADYFFKSTSLFYAMFTLLIGYYALVKYQIKYPMIIILITAITFGFMFTSLQFNIDHYRIYPMILSTLFWVESLKHKNKNLFWVFCFLAGLQSFIHSIGVFFSIIQITLFIFFCGFTLRERWILIPTGVFIFLVSGAIHYVLDVFYGTGWIFKEIKFH